MVAAAAECLDDLLDQAIVDSFKVHFKDGLPLRLCIDAWSKIVATLAPYALHNLRELLGPGGPPRKFYGHQNFQKFRNQVEAGAAGREEVAREFRKLVRIDL